MFIHNLTKINEILIPDKMNSKECNLQYNQRELKNTSKMMKMVMKLMMLELQNYKRCLINKNILYTKKFIVLLMLN